MPPYPIYQGQSAQILFDAIARSNGTRGSVSDQLFRTNVKNGIMGTFHFDQYGDITPTKYITIEKLKGNAGVYAGVSITRVKPSLGSTRVSGGRAVGPSPLAARRR